jgi:uncharacterized membrane protein HdeD (DUF308 family)
MSEMNLAQARDRAASAVRAIWWLTLVRGILLILLGCYALFSPGMTVVALTRVIGLFLILEGFLAVWAGVSGQTSTRLWTIVRGVLLILAGLFFFSQPVLMAAIKLTVVIWLIAASFVASGVAEIYTAIRDRKQIEGEGWLILGGVLAIIFGLILVGCPLSAGLLLVRVVGVFAAIAGIALIAAAFRLRNFGQRLKT